MTAAGATPTKAGRREWFGLAVLALPTFVVAIDLFVLLLALPTLTKSLGAGSVQQLWVTDIYGFLLAGLLVTMGTVGDRIGRRKLLIIGGAAFAVLSVLCAYAPTIELLITARALLGITGATLMPSTLALIGGLFQDPKQQATAFGIWGGTFTLGAVFGPVLGGLLLAHFWWGSVFLIGAPLMVALVILGPKVLPEFKNPQPGRLDFTSVVLSLLALLPIIYGIKQLAKDGWEVLPIVSLVVGLVFGYLFVRRQRRLESPLLDLGLFTHKTIGTTLLNQLSYSTMGGGIMLLLMLYFQLVQGLNTVQAGLVLVPGMIAGALGFQVAPKLAYKVRPAYVIGGGMFLAALTYVIFAVFPPHGSPTLLIVGFALISFFGSPTVALGTNLVVTSAPMEKMGSAGSLAQLSNEFGGTLGIAVLGTVATAVYRNTVALPAGLSAGGAASAHDSLAGAVTTAAKLPAGEAHSVLNAASDAFTSGLHAVATIGAVLFVLMAVFVSTRLRPVPPFGSVAPPPAPEAAPSSSPSEAEAVVDVD